MKILKTLLCSTAMLATSVASAHNLILDSRFDYTGTSSSTSTASAGSFTGSRLRLAGVGKINDQVTAKLRFNLLKSQDAQNSENKFSNYIDYAFIQHQISENVTLSAGKLIALIGGREAMTNTADYYFASLAGAEIIARPLNAYLPTGAMVTYMIGEQRIDFLAANTTQDDASAQTRLMTGFSFLGSFAEKTILPILSYHQDNESENTDKRTYATIGSRFIISSFELDLDYLSNMKSYKTWTSGANKETNSLVASLRYKLNDMNHFILKLDGSSTKVANTSNSATDPDFSNETKTYQTALAYEYMPTGNKNFRYHTAVHQAETRPTGSDSSKETKYYVGVRLLNDFLN